MSAVRGHTRLAWQPVWSLAAVCRFINIRPRLYRSYSTPRLEIPVNEYYEYFGPDYKLDVRASNMEDLNTREYLDRVKSIVMENLRQLGGPPSVQMMGWVSSILIHLFIRSHDVISSTGYRGSTATNRPDYG